MKTRAWKMEGGGGPARSVLLKHPALVLLLLTPLWLGGALGVSAQSTSFTYQGQLLDNGQPAQGRYDLRLILFSADIGGNQVGPILTNANVQASGGLFLTVVDFGDGVFDGRDLWLDIALRPGGNAQDFTPLYPRQRLAAVPYAHYSRAAGQAAQAAHATLAATASAVAPAAVTTSGLAPGAVDSSRIADGSIAAEDLSPTLLSETFWRLTGNAAQGKEGSALK